MAMSGLRNSAAGAFLILFSLVVWPCNATEEFDGEFLGDLVLKARPGGREFELVQAFSYLDPKKIEWVVPIAAVVDGASIPPYLWSFIGAPWTGEYREASVIHDYFFEQKKYDSDSVHRVFYDAMLTSNVPRLKALLMYYAVLRFNDRWEMDWTSNYACLGRSDRATAVNCYPVLADELEYESRYFRKQVEFDEEELKSVQKSIENDNMSVEALEQLAKENLAKSGID